MIFHIHLNITFLCRETTFAVFPNLIVSEDDTTLYFTMTLTAGVGGVCKYLLTDANYNCYVVPTAQAIFRIVPSGSNTLIGMASKSTSPYADHVFKISGS